MPQGEPDGPVAMKPRAPVIETRLHGAAGPPCLSGNGCQHRARFLKDVFWARDCRAAGRPEKAQPDHAGS